MEEMAETERKGKALPNCFVEGQFFKCLIAPHGGKLQEHPSLACLQVCQQAT